MPILVHVDELEPGMRLKRAIVRDKQVMLSCNKPLEDWQINSLRRRFPDLTVQICDPILDEFVEFQDDSRDHEVSATVNRQMARLMHKVREILSTKTALEGPDISGLQRSVAEVMQYIMKTRPRPPSSPGSATPVTTSKATWATCSTSASWWATRSETTSSASDNEPSAPKRPVSATA